MDKSDYPIVPDGDSGAVALYHDVCGHFISNPMNLEEANRDAGNHDEECS